jgi:hypothetical protein
MHTVPRGKIIISVTNAEAKGVFEEEPNVELQTLAGGAIIRRIYKADKVPVPNIKMSQDDHLGDIANDRGITVLEFEMPPGETSPMHTTPSIDFGTMITGEITLILDSGEERTLKYVAFPLRFVI